MFSRYELRIISSTFFLLPYKLCNKVILSKKSFILIIH